MALLAIVFSHLGSLWWFGRVGVVRICAQWKDFNLVTGFLTCLGAASLGEVFSIGRIAILSRGLMGVHGPELVG